MRLPCWFCSGWNEYDGLMTVDKEHEEGCSDRRKAYREKTIRERGYDPFLLHANDMLPTYVPRETKISTFNARSNLYKLNFNVLFSTFDMVAAAWPEATVC